SWTDEHSGAVILPIAYGYVGNLGLDCSGMIHADRDGISYESHRRPKRGQHIGRPSDEALGRPVYSSSNSSAYTEVRDVDGIPFGRSSFDGCIPNLHQIDGPRLSVLNQGCSLLVARGHMEHPAEVGSSTMRQYGELGGG